MTGPRERGSRPQQAGTAFSGALLDRAAAMRCDERFTADRWSDPASRAVAVTSEGVLVVGDPSPVPARLEPSALAGDLVGERAFLGIEDGHPLFAVDLDHAGSGAVARLAPGARVLDLREAGARLSQADGGLVAYASALVDWHRRTRFCSVCGAVTEVRESGHSRGCPHCGTVHHPRTDPVVIMLVTHDDRVLLGRQPTWPAGFYSALAGFVEPGESLEEAVAREVSEEAGVEICDPHYVSSQPWPFPYSLMLGFRAAFAGGEPSTRDRELEDVRWFSRTEVANAARDRGELRLPPAIAIARRLIEGWLDEGSTDR